MTIPDPDDSSTWMIDGDLTDRQRESAIIWLDDWFHPVAVATPPDPVVEIRKRLDALEPAVVTIEQSVEKAAADTVVITKRVETLEAKAKVPTEPSDVAVEAT